jgi:hypothetical protein
MAVVIVMMKSGAARVQGQKRPRPPEASPSWLMRIAEGEIDGWSRMEVRKVDMISSMLDVRGPFHSSHFGSGSLIGRLYRMSDDKRCGSFCRRHWENSQSLVCLSVMEVDRVERQSLMAETCEEKNLFANMGEPTG